MTIQYNCKIIRRPSTLERVGCSKTTLHSLEKRKLFVSSISIGERAVGYLEHEVQALIAARAANKSDEEIRLLVVKLEEQRKQTANTYLCSLAA